MSEKCTQCGAELGPPEPREVIFGWRIGRAPHPVTLVEGASVRTCSGCGDEEISIPRLAGLEAAITASPSCDRFRLVDGSWVRLSD